MTPSSVVAHRDRHVAGFDAGAVQQVNRRWSNREQIVDFRLLRWVLSSDDELTPTMKVRRAVLCEQYAELIEEMYDGDL